MVSYSIPADRSNLVDTHKPRHAMLAACLPSLAEIEKDPRCAVNAVTRDEGRSDQPQKPCILKGTVRDRRLQPGVVPAGSDLQEPAQRPNVVFGRIGFDELVDPSVDPSDFPSAELGWHRLLSVPVVPLESRVHVILGSPGLARRPRLIAARAVVRTI